MKKLHPNAPKRPGRYGLEWRILKQTPMAFLLSGAAIYASTLIAHWLLRPEDTSQALKHTEFINIIGISALITVWTAIFTVAIGAFTVYVMKGPAYVADSLKLIDSERPLPHRVKPGKAESGSGHDL